MMSRAKIKKIIIGVVLILMVVLISRALFSSKPHSSNASDEKSSNTSENKAMPTAKPALTVNIVQPRIMQLPNVLAANGNVAAWQEASIGSESNGLRLTEVNVNVGDHVRKGQVLATYAAETIQADVAQAEANLLETQAHAAQDYANADRAKRLDAEGALSKQEISLYYTNAKAAEAKVAAAKATLNAQKIRLKFTTVLAPDDGIISSRSATVGAVVNGGTELFRMIRQGRLEWRAEVTSAELNHIRIGDNAVITTTSGGVPVHGTVRMIAPTVNPQSRAAIVYVDLPAANNAVKAGMYARGEFQLNQTNATTLPQAAVVLRDGFNYIFVVGADQHVQRMKVDTGRLVGNELEILTALEPHARIVSTGAGFLNDGDLVRVATTSSTTSLVAAK
ncbi:MAG: efflux RND transporter periplasmic adaptor subunit [Aquirhabdus sp.]